MFCAAVCSLLIVGGCSPNTASLRSIKAEVLDSGFVFERAPFPSCHASTIVQTSDGGLLSAWFGGRHESAPDVCIYASHGIGGAWTLPSKVAWGGEIEGCDSLPCWNPVLYRNVAGQVALFYKIGKNPRTWKGYMKVSPDNGMTWTQPYALPEGFLGPIKNKPVLITGGLILCPSSVEAPSSSGDDPIWTVHLETCRQDFGGWQRIDIHNASFSAIQPTILNYQDGSMQLLCRTRDESVVSCKSRDGGVSWTPLERTSLPNNNSGIDAVTCYGAGMNRKFQWLQVLVYNPTTKTPAGNGRNRLAVTASFDGLHWRQLMTLEDSRPGTEFSYPAVICSVDSDGYPELHITYTYNRERIKYVRLRISD